MRVLFWAVLVSAIAGASLAQPGKSSSVVPVAALPENAVIRPVALTRLRADFRPDEAIGNYKGVGLCVVPEPIRWAQVAKYFGSVKDVFSEELKATGFRPAIDPGNLFPDQEAAAATDIQVGALFKSLNVDICEGVVRTDTKVTLDMEWQVYSSLRREVLLTLQTHETAETLRGSGGDQGRSAYQSAFAQNVRSLLASDAFRKIVTAADGPSQNGASSAGASTPIGLVGAAKGPTSLETAVGSVVSIFAGGAFGSGVLVSTDGYVLTNHHVVGDNTQVKIRWSDGLEATGNVVRSDRRRDVALVKTESRGRVALAVNRNLPGVGTPVFAIGTPLDPKLHGTVTRGIVSASRIIDGFSFIQSDTPVTHGNSGGPLLDEHGAIVGLTDLGLPPEKGSSLNFFIPIGDALDFLGLKTGN